MADIKPENIPSSLHDFIIGNIQLEKKIGIGANGRILEAKWEQITVAVKEIHSIFINEVSEQEFQTFKRSFLRECEQSNLLRHPNIVRFLGIYNPPGARVPSLVIELVMERRVAGLLNQSARTKLTPSDRNKAVNYLRCSAGSKVILDCRFGSTSRVVPRSPIFLSGHRSL